LTVVGTEFSSSTASIPHLGGVMKRVHDDAALERSHGDEVLSAVQRELADPNLALHPVTHHREGVAGHAAVWRQIVRAIDVHRVKGAGVGELHEIDHARGFRADLVQIIV
jgi:hypothetical protein